MFLRLFGSRSTTGDAKRWPVYPLESVPNPKFLFILTPPCSGSTMLAKVFNTVPGSMLLHPRAEGTWLVPGTSVAEAWDPTYAVNWESVRSVWLRRVDLVQSLVGPIGLVIEKSPRLLMRSAEIPPAFPNSAFVALNRDPFASCSSVFHRFSESSSMTRSGRIQEFRRLAENWVRLSRALKDAIESLRIPKIRYEDFCAQPSACVQKLAHYVPELAQADTESPIQVKDYPTQRVSNQNERQLAWLTTADVRAIDDVLETEDGLVRYFGYSVSGKTPTGRRRPIAS